MSTPLIPVESVADKRPGQAVAVARRQDPQNILLEQLDRVEGLRRRLHRQQGAAMGAESRVQSRVEAGSHRTISTMATSSSRSVKPRRPGRSSACRECVATSALLRIHQRADRDPSLAAHGPPGHRHLDQVHGGIRPVGHGRRPLVAGPVLLELPRCLPFSQSPVTISSVSLVLASEAASICPASWPPSRVHNPMLSHRHRHDDARSAPP